MAVTYKELAKVTVGAGGASSIDFTSIPATYTDLSVFISARSSGADPNIMIRFNSSSSNFSQVRLYSDGSSLISAGTYAEFSAWATASTFTASMFGNSLIYIPNYTSANYKSFNGDGVSENQSTTAYSTLTAGLWSDTSAITSISFIMGSSFNFAQYSTAYLYGIKNS